MATYLALIGAASLGLSANPTFFCYSDQLTQSAQTLCVSEAWQTVVFCNVLAALGLGFFGCWALLALFKAAALVPRWAG